MTIELTFEDFCLYVCDVTIVLPLTVIIHRADF